MVFSHYFLQQLKESKNCYFYVFYSKELVAMIVSNPNTRINKQDAYGVNAFWVAAFYGNIDVRMCFYDYIYR
jgi:hypothetical protein